MKASIKTEVSTRKQARALEIGLTDPAVKGFVIVMGMLMQLPSDRSRRRVLTYMQDKINEMDHGY